MHVRKAFAGDQAFTCPLLGTSGKGAMDGCIKALKLSGLCIQLGVGETLAMTTARACNIRVWQFQRTRSLSHPLNFVTHAIGRQGGMHGRRVDHSTRPVVRRSRFSEAPIVKRW